MSGERTGEFLEDTLAVRQSRTDARPAASPRRIGPYELVERIGAGGMGEVWLAEQVQPIRRRVAVKIIRAGMDADVVARFMSERQALAMMEHPAIAKVFDAGSTPEGQPYFAMEYVNGLPIDRHCDEHRLSIAERLALFAEVCDGVQHAHQKAVIHRDLKPSNILVTLVDGRAQPKIIDFGIAKAIGTRLSDATMLTELGGIVGTPEYMSPEQADLSAQGVDTRSDVYSLGVVLYQLLTGELPFTSDELRRGGYDELRRTLKEAEPTRPSTQVGRLGPGAEVPARARATDADALRRQLTGDLDAITLKALEKERERRYGTASQFAEDLRHYLGHEPVIARPPSASYRIWKYVRRHRLAVAVATAAALVLPTFTVALAVQVRRVSRERDRANHEAETALRVSDFMARMFKAATPEEARGRQVTAREVLDRAAQDVQSRLGTDPVLQARLMSAIGDAYFALGQAGEARPLLEKTVETFERLAGPSSESALRSRNTYGQLLRQDSRGAAENYIRETLTRAEKALGPTHDVTLRARRDLTSVLLDEGKLQEGEKEARELVQLVREANRPDSSALMVALSDLATSLSRQHRFKEAAEARSEAIRIQTKLSGADHPDTIALLGNQAADEYGQGHHAEAERLQLAVLDYERRVLGPTHPNTLLQMSNLANTYAAEGRFDEAERLLTEVLESARKAEGDSSVSVVVALYNLACVAAAQPGQTARALGFLREAAELGMPGQMVAGMESDPDLAPLRSDPEFGRVLERARRSRNGGGR